MICFTKIICVFFPPRFFMCFFPHHQAADVPKPPTHRKELAERKVTRAAIVTQEFWGARRASNGNDSAGSCGFGDVKFDPRNLFSHGKVSPCFFFVCSPGLDFSQRSQWKYSYKGEHDFKNGMKMFQIVCFNVFFFWGQGNGFCGGDMWHMRFFSWRLKILFLPQSWKWEMFAFER